MAELYLQQGHLQKALEIYQDLVVRYPQDARFSERLLEIERIARGETMGFTEHLQKVVQGVPGTIAASLMGFDGIPIDTVTLDDSVDVAATLTEYTSAINLNQISSQGGSLQELSVAAANNTVILRFINEEYYLAVVLKPGAMLGKARFLMRVATPALAKELS